VSTDTTKAPEDNIGDEHDDGLWPDMQTSAESSVHENLPSHFAEDNLYPDETLSLESVKDDTRVDDADPQEHIDGLYPDETLSRESVVGQLDAFGEEESDAETSDEPEKGPSAVSDNDNGPQGAEPDQGPVEAKKTPSRKTPAERESGEG
jgi:hypothetical protein